MISGCGSRGFTPSARGECLGRSSMVARASASEGERAAAGGGGERSRQPSGNVMAATGERVRYNCSHSKIIVQTPRRSSQPMSIYGATELAKAFRTVRGNTIQIARDMPEDKYDFRPVAGARSVNELFRHIIYSPLFQEDVHRTKRATTFKGYDFGASLAIVHAAADKPKSKAEILDALEREGERVAT